MRKDILAAAMLGVASLGLAGCGEQASAPEEAAPEGVPGMSVENARMVLAPVAGNPAAVYFDLSYDGETNTTLRRADVAGAESSMMHDYGEWAGKMEMAEMGPLLLQKGDKVSFKPGSKHIMAMKVSPELKPGDTTEVTLTVIGGDKFSFTAEVRAAGDER
ncbi:MAG: copper chaperone PCu(A)C [Sphingomonadaceae bacterium]|nr:copper chaperone PCu(A)C [Sphingomonadaceae bacterium]